MKEGQCRESVKLYFWRKDSCQQTFLAQFPFHIEQPNLQKILIVTKSDQVKSIYIYIYIYI